jgi:hypothetical protein
MSSALGGIERSIECLISSAGERQENQQCRAPSFRARVEPALNIELKVHEAVPVSKGSAEDWVSLYVRAARYRRLLYFVADRVLGNPDKAAIAVEKCLYSAAQYVTAFDREGAFRSWLVRLAIDEALVILHGTRVLEHRHGDDAAAITSICSHRTEIHQRVTGSPTSGSL